VAKDRTKVGAERVRELLIYDPQSGVFTWRINRTGKALAGTVAGALDSDGYRQIRIDGRLYLAHRLAWLYVYGRWPRTDLDHVDLDRDHNAIDNLRPCSQSENNANTRVRSDNILGRKGVTYDATRRKYRARIRKHGRLYHLGWFELIEDAAAAYVAAAKHYFRTFARSRK
jgi:hypothetical protein